MRVAAAFLLITTTLLAGCTTPTSNDAASSEPPAETPAHDLATLPQAITATDCDMIEVVVRVDAEEVQQSGAIPPEFTLTIIGSETLAVLGTNHCTTDGGTMHRLFLAFQVTPNDPAWAGPPDTNHFYEPEHVVENGTAFATLMADLGAIVTTSDEMHTTVSPLASQSAAGLATGQHIVTTTQADLSNHPGQGFGQFREFFPAHGGYGYFQATYSSTAGTYGVGTGQVETAPGTEARTHLDATRQGAGLTGRGFTFENALVGFIATNQTSE